MPYKWYRELSSAQWDRITSADAATISITGGGVTRSAKLRYIDGSYVLDGPLAEYVDVSVYSNEITKSALSPRTTLELWSDTNLSGSTVRIDLTTEPKLPIIDGRRLSEIADAVDDGTYSYSYDFIPFVPIPVRPEVPEVIK